ncbi:MAG: peptide-methionine (R)-S-oxide reductase MsrB [Acidobacteriaceae bacterium]
MNDTTTNGFYSGMTEEEWKKKLTKDQYRYLREKGTEMPFAGKYVNSHEHGMYVCAACGNPLFSSETKFDSKTGWPSFTDPVNLEHVELKKDSSFGMERTEVLCKNCGSHLGHLFDDGPSEKGGKRYCINSACLNLIKPENSKESGPVKP